LTARERELPDDLDPDSPEGRALIGDASQPLPVRDAREIGRALLENPRYLRALRLRLIAGKVHPLIVQTIYHMTYGKPREQVSIDVNANLADLFALVASGGGQLVAQRLTQGAEKPSRREDVSINAEIISRDGESFPALLPVDPLGLLAREPIGAALGAAENPAGVAIADGREPIHDGEPIARGAAPGFAERQPYADARPAGRANRLDHPDAAPLEPPGTREPPRNGSLPRHALVPPEICEVPNFRDDPPAVHSGRAGEMMFSGDELDAIGRRGR
jgi:hypothetical protein